MIDQGILDQAEETILGIERHWLTRLQIALAQFPATEEDRAALERSVRQLDELFLLVVVGEFNAGKSALINALFGKPLLEMGVTPTTTRIHLLKHGDQVEQTAADAELDVYSVPAELLSEITIVDTPGTNAIYREHETMTQEFIPRSDLVLFVTSVDRPFTESERAFLEIIREWGKKVVIVLNKADIIETEEDLHEIEQFVQNNARALLHFAPDLFSISARQALRAKQSEDTALLAKSGLPALESYIVERLDEKERVRLKLLNPLGVGLHLIDKYLGVIHDRMALLQEDFEVMSNIERQLRTYREDMAREFRYRLADVGLALESFENRGMAYFDETMRLGRFFDLLDRSKLEAEFREEVVADTPEVVESRVDDITEWLVTRNQTQWQMVMEQVRRRRAAHANRMLGELPGTFEIDRRGLIESVGHAAQQALQTYDRRAEARRIAQSLQRAVASTALVEVGAVGLGTLVAVIATTTAMDVTGILAASTMAILGLLVLPNRKRKLKQELREKIHNVRETLIHTLTDQFDAEVTETVRQIEDAISPYTRFIRSQQTHWRETREELENIRKWLKRQENEIEAL